MSFRCRAVCVCVTVILTRVSPVQATTLQPDEAGSKDSFVYQFLQNMNFDSGGFQPLLSAGKTTTGHDTRSLLQFNVVATGLTSAQVTSATLEVFATSSTAAGFGQNPDADHPILIDLLPVAGGSTNWLENDLKWSNQPTTGALAASATQAGIDQWISFDVTSLVDQWLDGTLANNGLVLQQNEAVGNPGAFYVGVFDSASGANRPRLTLVPEPSSWLLALLAAPFVAWRVRRRATRARAHR